VIDVTDETETCWCSDAQGLLRAMIPYAIRSFNDSLDESKKLFADKLITDVGYALQPAHAGDIVAEQERTAARGLVAGVRMDDVNKLIDELGAIAVARALLMLRDLIQRLSAQAKSDANRANEGYE
jgi:hypothetical protein